MTTSQSPLDAAAIRGDFPILNRPLESGRSRMGQLPVFLDSGASAQKPQCVIDKEREVEERYYANAYRGVYYFGARVDEELEASRQKITSFIGSPQSDSVIFTAGTTMSINMVARGWGSKFLHPGDEVLITEMEHHANIVPWQLICAERGARLRWLPITAERTLDLSKLDELLTRKTKMVAVTAMSNVLGTINPIDELTRRAHEVGAVIMVDGAQSIPHLKVNVAESDIDFLAFSGHKIFGPSGVGVLYGRLDLLAEMNPFLGGGHMIDRVFKTHSTWSEPPAKFEAGTLPIVQAIGLGTAIDYVSLIGLDRIHTYEADLLAYAHQRLNEIPGLTIYGPRVDQKGAICSFTIQKAHPEDLANLLDMRGVFVRHGHHCAMPLHDILGVSATVRASFSIYNTKDEVDLLVAAIHAAIEKLKRN